MLALAFIPLSGSQTAMPYDPWADINNDGKIDMKDIGYICRLFETYGDPTKKVIINHNYTSVSYVVRIPTETGGHINITTAGYRQITLYLYVPSVSINIPILGSYSFDTNISVATGFLIGNMCQCIGEYIIKFTVHVNPPPIPPISIIRPSAKNYLPGYSPKMALTYDVRGPVLSISWWNPNKKILSIYGYGVTLIVEAYLTT
jgi:hypothetical protein